MIIIPPYTSTVCTGNSKIWILCPITRIGSINICVGLNYRPISWWKCTFETFSFKLTTERRIFFICVSINMVNIVRRFIPRSFTSIFKMYSWRWNWCFNCFRNYNPVFGFIPWRNCLDFSINRYILCSSTIISNSNWRTEYIIQCFSKIWSFNSSVGLIFNDLIILMNSSSLCSLISAVKRRLTAIPSFT